MLDFTTLLKNPELAKVVKFEITGRDLLTLAGSLIQTTREATLIEARTGETYVTIEEACLQVRRDKRTLGRWHEKGILKYNSLNLYKQSDITNLLNK